MAREQEAEEDERAEARERDEVPPLLRAHNAREHHHRAPHVAQRQQAPAVTQLIS